MNGVEGVWREGTRLHELVDQREVSLALEPGLPPAPVLRVSEQLLVVRAEVEHHLQHRKERQRFREERKGFRTRKQPAFPCGLTGRTRWGAIPPAPQYSASLPIGMPAGAAKREKKSTAVCTEFSLPGGRWHIMMPAMTEQDSRPQGM